MRVMPLIAVGLVVGIGVGWWLFDTRGDAVDIAPVDPATVIAVPETAAAGVPGAVAPEAVPVAGAPPVTAPPVASPSAMPPPAPVASGSGLLLPVQGIQPSQLQDTFTDARSEGRVHDAIDIMAAEGTPVLAVADGQVEKLFDSDKGGLTMYQFDPDGVHCYYYAHLQRYADGLAEKKQIKRGEVIGYVGSTGNANKDAPHLHFEIHLLGPEKQWWKGESINPYPLLTQR
ncbi:M23 family metallopeptidase [Stenotrophomonas sp. CFBP 13718]|uniref:M23 family metallopeptidase n=1 Tax=Stenotrophomonas sp. CFBP 13718 TaxID=2775304 RepID=UPI0017820146|nr:M23 family metallopeptidase [Stenotrophomonas sp. CFBP 13718]MBD8697464.1 M23 family metallopeptidase [Stenotrophomonas sp. CFBP 13718]